MSRFNMTNNFYVYRHIRLDTNTVFYVGKGKDNRAYTKRRRNKYWTNIVNKVGYRVEIVQDKLSEKQAFDKEIKLIAKHKKKGECEANLTLGGEGVSSVACYNRRVKEIERLKNALWNHSILELKIKLEQLLVQAEACDFKQEANKIKALLNSQKVV